MRSNRVLVIGLDCAPPELVFERFRDSLPTISSLMDGGFYGSLESCHPPITIPAWIVMATGREPGELGMYGFRHRKLGSYDETYIVNSHSVKYPAVWDELSKRGMRSCIVSVPPGYPPKPVKGCWVSCFITPSADKQYTYPSLLRFEIERVIGEKYVFDVEFRTEQRKRLLRELYHMTDLHFKAINHLASRKKWDFFMFVEIGVDRVHHAFWKFFDPTHHLYTPGNEFEHVIEDYYKYVDQKIAELLKVVGKDVLILVVSDHGAKGMRGAFCVNEWLIEKGYLVIKHKPGGVVDLEKLSVDWDRTKAWGWGGYYARIFINVRGREPRGVIDPSSYESFREELADELRKIDDPSGRRMETKVYKPEQLYSTVSGDYPDLLVYFDDLYWRSAGTLGHGTMYLPENDIGPDDAVHSMHGVYILHDPEGRISQGRRSASIYDIAPTLFELFGLEKPIGLRGRSLVEAV